MIKKYLFSKFSRPCSSSPDAQNYLLHLGKCLLPYFPLSQIQEILLDYQEYLSAGKERGFEEAALLETLDSPEKTAQALLNESPGQRAYRWTQALPWAMLLWASLVLFRLFQKSAPYPFYAAALLLFLGAVSFSCFGLLHGWNLVFVEGQFSETPPLSRPFLLAQMLLPMAVVLAEWGMQALLNAPDGSIPVYMAGIPTGTLCSRILWGLMLFGVLTAGWTIFKTRRDSVRYYPGAVHALGASLTFWDMRHILRSMDLVERPMENAFLLSLLFYAAGLIAALAVAVSMRAQRSKSSGGEVV